VGPITESVYASGVVKAQGPVPGLPHRERHGDGLAGERRRYREAGQAAPEHRRPQQQRTTRNADAQLRLLEQNARDRGPCWRNYGRPCSKPVTNTRWTANYARQQALVGPTDRQPERAGPTRAGLHHQQGGLRRASQSALKRPASACAPSWTWPATTLAISSAGNDDRTPRSLIDGIVYDLRIEPGELATTQKAVAVIGSATDLYLELEVDEYDITQVKPGQKAVITLDSYSGQAFGAEVTRIIPLMDERSRTFRVEARFTEPPPMLFPNPHRRGQHRAAHQGTGPDHPRGLPHRWQLRAHRTDERTPVKVGARDLEKVEVLEGIDALHHHMWRNSYKPVFRCVRWALR
jgi:hypothetical protein